MGNDNTLKALLARGFDTNIADKLIKQGYTLAKLQVLDELTLRDLGLTDDMIKVISEGSRSPIPNSTVIHLLYASKWTCCVCRDPSRGVVIHHIKEWCVSHDHSMDNLIVLCPLHHDEAHTHRSLTLNYTEERLKGLRDEWYQAVKLDDRKIILKIIADPEARWAYFNHARIFELLLIKNVVLKDFQEFSCLRENHLIDDRGVVMISGTPGKMCFYNTQYGIYLRYYMHMLVNKLFQDIPFIDITDKFTKKELIALIREGTFIAFQAAFYFRNISKVNEGMGQQRMGYYHKQNIRIQFIIDPYECTSVSSYCTHLSGHKVATVLGLVTSLIQEGDELIITMSCMAIGAYMNIHDKRNGELCFDARQEVDENSIF